MSIVAALLWNKSSRPNISMLIFDEDDMQILFPAKIEYFSHTYFAFRREVKKVIANFFVQLLQIQQQLNKPIIIEYKIVFHPLHIRYMIPAKESKFVYKIFYKQALKTTAKFKNIQLMPQLRHKLSGKALKYFKRELKALHLVRRNRDTGYEYHLWTIALHATSSTYKKKLEVIRDRLMQEFWNSKSYSSIK